MTNRLPPELHIVHGTKAEHKAAPLPEKVRARVPQANWLENPDAWDMATFIKETSDFLWDTYGIGSDQDKHTLAALATQLDIYVRCWKGMQEEGILTAYNDGKTIGPSPYITVGDKALQRALVLMGELGLTPKARLAAKPAKGTTKIDKLLAGP